MPRFALAWDRSGRQLRPRCARWRCPAFPYTIVVPIPRAISRSSVSIGNSSQPVIILWPHQIIMPMHNAQARCNTSCGCLGCWIAINTSCGCPRLLDINFGCHARFIELQVTESYCTLHIIIIIIIIMPTIVERFCISCRRLHWGYYGANIMY